MGDESVLSPASRGDRRLGILALGALGVVYGDIGTSVLYALGTAFDGAHTVSLTSESILGILSLIFWALVLVVGVKYLAFVMRADNRGEGGILALLALLAPRRRLIHYIRRSGTLQERMILLVVSAVEVRESRQNRGSRRNPLPTKSFRCPYAMGSWRARMCGRPSSAAVR